jgi:3-hydroxy-9,10-secoandrosta-1,3,5(10)-triene-9,17-dione monooxygenase
MVERARALRPWLREEQRATEQRGRYSEEIHEEFRRAGFYRCLQPRRYGGYEFDVGTFYRVVQEISRGCPSTGWMLSLAAGHALLLASYFPEQAQMQAFGPDGEFLAPSVASLTGSAAPSAGGIRLINRRGLRRISTQAEADWVRIPRYPVAAPTDES